MSHLGIRPRGRRASALALLLLATLLAVPSAPAAAGDAVDRSSYDMDAEYDVRATIGWGSRRLRVDTTIDLVNTSGGPVSRLELNTIAHVLGDMVLRTVRVDGGQPAGVVVRGQTILVQLAEVLAEGEGLRVRVVYSARPSSSTAVSHWLFARRGDVLSLYRFIPWLSRKVMFSRDNTGDPFVTPAASRVRVTFTSDRPLVYATSGVRVAHDGLSQTFEAHDVRDFNVSASPRYAIHTRRSADGDTLIRAYTVGGGARTLLGAAKRALDTFEDWIGPYPYPVLNVAESAGGYAMESPALLWMPLSDLAGQDLPYVTAHEVAHQWFYAVVGNDQTRDMFADEGLSTFLSRTLHGRLRGSRCPQDRLDRPLYQYTGRCYYEVIYIQGSSFLDKLRLDMGSPAFWTALRSYYRENRFAVSTNRRLLQALRAEAGDWVLPRYRARFPSLFRPS